MKNERPKTFVMRKLGLAALVSAGFSVAPFAAFAENSNDPNRDVNATSEGTRMRNAGEPNKVPTQATAGRASGRTSVETESTQTTESAETSRTATIESEHHHHKKGTTATTGQQPTSTKTNANSSNSTSNTSATTQTAIGGGASAAATAVGSQTAQDQSNRATDTEMTRKIRQDLMNSDLSMASKNVTIITAGGVVTLKGEVPATEKTRVNEIARSAAGSMNVKDETTAKK